MLRDLRLTFLGTGTSSGVPAIGCDCPVCRSADPRDRRLRTSGLIEFVDPLGAPRALLIDAGPDLREQALRRGMTRCDAIFFTHGHVDHTFGLDEVRRFNATMRAPIPIYASRPTMEQLQRVYRHIFERAHGIDESFVATLLPHLVEPLRSVDLHGVRVTPLPLLHGRLPILGYRVDALGADGAVAAAQPAPLPMAWLTDVSGVPPETWPRLVGLDTLVLDMLRYRRHPTHLSLDEAVAMSGEIGARRTYFVHMSHEIAHAELAPRLPEGVHLAHDELTVAD